VKGLLDLADELLVEVATNDVLPQVGRIGEPPGCRPYQLR
jgi:hypothetical protein